MTDILSKIKVIDFQADQYVNEVTDKIQIIGHHTVSGDNIKAISSWWTQNKSRVATHIIIDRKGTPWQLFSSKYYAWHLALKQEDFTQFNLPWLKLDKTSIAIEFASWGYLKKIDDNFYNCYGGKVNQPVTEYENGFRGFRFYESYTPEQIETYKELIIYFNDKYNIPLNYNEDMWDISENALMGKPGIWTHVSFNKDSGTLSRKHDMHPQPELISMLKSLTV